MPRVNPNIKLWTWGDCDVLMFISYNKMCYTLLGDIDNRRDYACMGAGVVWKICVPSPQLCCEPKIYLEN